MSEQSLQRADFKVVKNHEEQYSIWPADRENAPRWIDEGTSGTKEECLAHIERVWTDMRPLSLRKRMEEAVPAARAPGDGQASREREFGRGASLIDRLCANEHLVIVSVRPEGSAAACKIAIERGYANIRFIGTRGDTELRIRLSDDSRRSAALIDESSGRVRLEGDLVLDYIPLRCVAEVELDTLKGTGRLYRTG